MRNLNCCQEPEEKKTGEDPRAEHCILRRTQRCLARSARRTAPRSKATCASRCCVQYRCRVCPTPCIVLRASSSSHFVLRRVSRPENHVERRLIDSVQLLGEASLVRKTQKTNKEARNAQFEQSSLSDTVSVVRSRPVRTLHRGEHKTCHVFKT